MRIVFACAASVAVGCAGGSRSGSTGAAGSSTGAAGSTSAGAAGNTSAGAAGSTSAGAAGNASAGAAGNTSAGAAGSSSGAAGHGGAAGASSTGAAGAGAAGATGAAGSMTNPTGAGGGLGMFPGLDPGPVSDGATITFQMIGAPGMYPSRRDPAKGPCDVEMMGTTCCLTNQVETGDALKPWDEELSATLRGPMLVKQMAVYQPASGTSGPWNLTSSWDARAPTAGTNIAFSGPPTPGATSFAGVVGNKCLVDVSTAKEFPCGAGSVPYCPAPGAGQHKYYGWAGSKLYVWLATFPHYGSGAITNAQNCNNATTDGWYDAPWIGISHGELVRQGLYNGCQCYSYPNNPNAGNGCGQLNAFEVVNDNNTYRNLDVFSTNFFGYAGYVGEGPCGTGCNVTSLPASVDLVNKKTGDTEAAAGAISTPKQGPGAAFRRPATGYRYVIVLFDVASRTVQQAFIHPGAVPASVSALLPGLPAQVPQTTIDALVALRLPH
ncbi:MAG TPA: DUF2403 domain-containing protein [Polyangia bacterium]|nr:DUF2403 domain-containing protein [Polyangia bacterium]